MFSKISVKFFISILFIIFLTSNTNALTFSDGTFKNEDWTLIIQSLGNGGTSIGSQQSSGGNPEEYRQVYNELFPGHSGVVGYHFFKNSAYNPSVQGEITSVDFSMDNKMFIGFGEGQSIGAAIYQDGKSFMGGITGVDCWADQNYWVNLSYNLKAENFFIFEGNPAIHPDFSINGGPILFGFHTANGGGDYSITIGIDNWSVNLQTNPVPLPSAVILLGSGLARLVIYNRRRRNTDN